METFIHTACKKAKPVRKGTAKIKLSITENSLNLKKHISVRTCSLKTIQREVIGLIKEKLNKNER